MNQEHKVSFKATAAKRLDSFPPFDVGKYLARNPDVAKAGIGASAHFLQFGSSESRLAFEKIEVAKSIGSVRDISLRPLDPLCVDDITDRIGVYCSSSGNVFMNEIAQRLYRAIKDMNLAVSLLDENSEIEQRPALCIFVAPHEFFKLGIGVKWSRDEIISKSIMVNTEQIQEKWFHIAAPYLFGCAGIVDLSWQNAKLFEQSGVPSVFWMPDLTPNRVCDLSFAKSHPLARAINFPSADANSDIVDDRPISVSFFGAHTPHRDKFFAYAAKRLATHKNFIYLRRAASSLNHSNNGEQLLHLTKYVSGLSKAVLNIHRDEVAYFEWHRVVDIGMASGAVVVSEPCPPNPIYRPSVHYFSEEARYIPDLLDFLLLSEDGKSERRSVIENVWLLASQAHDKRLEIGLRNFLVSLYFSRFR